MQLIVEVLWVVAVDPFDSAVSKGWPEAGIHNSGLERIL